MADSTPRLPPGSSFITTAAPDPDLLVDLYSPLAHKPGLKAGTEPAGFPRWVPKESKRRLLAYRVLSAYVSNVARSFLRSEKAKRTHREYGDAGVIVDRIVAGVLGDHLGVVVDGAERPPTSVPPIAPKPEAPTGEVSEVEQRIYDTTLARWEESATEALERWESEQEAYPDLRRRQDYLDEWFDAEQVRSKLYEQERGSTVPLGDGVLALNLSGGRPALTVHEPDAYFPVLDDDAPGAFPSTVHLAWEFERDEPDGSKSRWVRRITYRLGPILPAQDRKGGFFDRDTLVDRRNSDGSPVAASDSDRAVQDEAGQWRIGRKMPWHVQPEGDDQPADDSLSYQTCYLSDGQWPISGAKARGGRWEDLTDDAAQWNTNEEGTELRDLDLRIDFVPVIHTPCFPASSEHFGRSALALLLQLLDDIGGVDTDRVKASALSASPMIAVSGSKLPKEIRVEPGTALPAENVDVIDTSGSMQPLANTLEQLRDLLAVNSSVTKVVMGRVSGNEVPSGIALKLSFAPFEQLISALRLTRQHKYGLMLKMVQRMAQAAGQLDPGPTPATRIQFGAATPTDVDAAVKNAASLLLAGGASRATALGILSDAGIDNGDPADELARIASEDPEGAKLIAEATASERLAAEYLGVDLPEPAQPATPPTLALPTFNDPAGEA